MSAGAFELEIVSQGWLDVAERRARRSVLARRHPARDRRPRHRAWRRLGRLHDQHERARPAAHAGVRPFREVPRRPDRARDALRHARHGQLPGRDRLVGLAPGRAGAPRRRRQERDRAVPGLDSSPLGGRVPPRGRRLRRSGEGAVRDGREVARRVRASRSSRRSGASTTSGSHARPRSVSPCERSWSTRLERRASTRCRSPTARVSPSGSLPVACVARTSRS